MPRVPLHFRWLIFVLFVLQTDSNKGSRLPGCFKRSAKSLSLSLHKSCCTSNASLSWCWLSFALPKLFCWINHANLQSFAIFYLMTSKAWPQRFIRRFIPEMYSVLVYTKLALSCRHMNMQMFYFQCVRKEPRRKKSGKILLLIEGFIPQALKVTERSLSHGNRQRLPNDHSFCSLAVTCVKWVPAIKKSEILGEASVSCWSESSVSQFSWLVSCLSNPQFLGVLGE
jgi:hypothetical protein